MMTGRCSEYNGHRIRRAERCANSPGSGQHGGADMTKRTTCSVEGCGRPVESREWCGMHYQRWRKNGDPESGGTFKGQARRFARQAAEFNGDECLEWPYAKGPRGYGRINIDGRTVRVHRYVLALATGESHDDLVVAHEPVTCHNPSCVNPNHLRWATQAENASDRWLDGTAGYENRSTTKLTSDQVLAIVADDRAQSEIATDYGVSQSHISGIKNGTYWSRVTGIDHE